MEVVVKLQRFEMRAYEQFLRSTMRLSSRVEHPQKGAAYELQSFVCPECGHIQRLTMPTPNALPVKKGKR
jgi:hypothetical protein